MICDLNPNPSLYISGYRKFYSDRDFREHNHKSFALDQNFRAGIVNHMVLIGTSEHISQIICFILRLRSADRKSFDSDRDFHAGSWTTS